MFTLPSLISFYGLIKTAVLGDYSSIKWWLFFLLLAAVTFWGKQILLFYIQRKIGREINGILGDYLKGWASDLRLDNNYLETVGKDEGEKAEI